MIPHRSFYNALIAVFFIGTAATGAHGQDILFPEPPPVIRVTGESVLVVHPDIAEIELGVESEGVTAEIASRNNAARLDSVLKALHERLGPEADIQTVNYSIRPVYSRPRDGAGKITHYAVSNVVRVRTGEFMHVGEIIDLATREGANTMRGLRFTLKDDAAARREALGEAARQARLKAEALALALGVRIKRVLEMVESGLQARVPLRQAMAMDLSSQPHTPIEPGDLEIRASVTLVVEVIN